MEALKIISYHSFFQTLLITSVIFNSDVVLGNAALDVNEFCVIYLQRLFICTMLFTLMSLTLSIVQLLKRLGELLPYYEHKNGTSVYVVWLQCFTNPEKFNTLYVKLHMSNPWMHAPIFTRITSIFIYAQFAF